MSDAKKAINDAGGLVTLADIAREAGVTHQAARKWRKAEGWPAPVAVLSGKHPVEVYLHQDIQAWKRARNAR